MVKLLHFAFCYGSFVENDQKTESFLRGNTIYFLYYFPKERPGALIRIRHELRRKYQNLISAPGRSFGKLRY